MPLDRTGAARGAEEPTVSPSCVDTPDLGRSAASVAPDMLPDGFRGLRDAANADEQFRLESRGMEGSLVFDIAGSSALLEISDGRIRSIRPSFQFSSSDVRLRCDAETWDRYRSNSPMGGRSRVRTS